MSLVSRLYCRPPVHKKNKEPEQSHKELKEEVFNIFSRYIIANGGEPPKNLASIYKYLRVECGIRLKGKGSFEKLAQLAREVEQNQYREFKLKRR